MNIENIRGALLTKVPGHRGDWDSVLEELIKERKGGRADSFIPNCGVRKIDL